MTRIDVKPLSVNEVWKGKRYKTDKYDNYTTKLMWLLPKSYKLPPPPYEIRLTWGFSSPLSDWDNPIKPFQDILAKKYGFNDKLIKRGVVESVSVEKGKEFIEFEIVTYKPNKKYERN